MSAAMRVVLVAMALAAGGAWAADAGPAEGLAARMREAASALQRGERHEATHALNQARHLGGAMASAPQVDAARAAAFSAAYDAVKQGRRALQDGDPDAAARRLAEGAAVLDAAPPAGAPAALSAADREKARGYNVLDAHGRKRGELRSIEGTPGAFTLALAAGGIAGLGAHDETLRAQRVYIGRHYLVAAEAAPAAVRPPGD